MLSLAIPHWYAFIVHAPNGVTHGRQVVSSLMEESFESLKNFDLILRTLVRKNVGIVDDNQATAHVESSIDNRVVLNMYNQTILKHQWREKLLPSLILAQLSKVTRKLQNHPTFVDYGACQTLEDSVGQRILDVPRSYGTCNGELFGVANCKGGSHNVCGPLRTVRELFLDPHDVAYLKIPSSLAIRSTNLSGFSRHP